MKTWWSHLSNFHKPLFFFLSFSFWLVKMVNKLMTWTWELPYSPPTFLPLEPSFNSYKHLIFYLSKIELSWNLLYWKFGNPLPSFSFVAFNWARNSFSIAITSSICSKTFSIFYAIHDDSWWFFLFLPFHGFLDDWPRRVSLIGVEIDEGMLNKENNNHHKTLALS